MTSAKQRNILPFFMAVFFFFFTYGEVSAQQYARIKLKDRSFLKGNILSGFDSTAVILIINGTTTRLPVSNIKSITFKSRWNKEEVDEMSDEGYVPFNPALPQYDKGFYHSVGIGIISGNEYTDFSASVVNGYRFHPLIQAGLGINYNRYEYITTLPLYLEYRAHPKKMKFAPYLFTQLGYGIRVEDTEPIGFENYTSEGGLYWGAGVGYQINFYQTALTLSFGYSSQQSRTEYSNPQFWGSSTVDYKEKREMGRMDIKLGLLF